MKKYLLPYFIVLLMLSGCQNLQQLSDSIRKPTLSLQNMRVTDFTFQEIELTYDVEVDNPNPVALQLLSYDYDLDINQNDFIEGQQPQRTRIASSGKSSFSIPVRLDFQQLYGLVSGLRDRDEADYNFAANLNFDLPVIGSTALPVSTSGTLPMLKLPTLSVADINVDNLSFTKADLSLEIGVQNPNAFGLLVDALSYDLSVNGTNWVSGRSDQQAVIGQKETGVIRIPLSINIAEMGGSVLPLLRNGQQAQYKLNGALNVGARHPLLEQLKTSFNFDEAGAVAIGR